MMTMIMINVMMVKLAFASFEISIVADIWDPLIISYRNSTQSILAFHGNTNHHKSSFLCAFAYYLRQSIYIFIFIWFSDDFPCSAGKELLLPWLLSKECETDAFGKIFASR